MDVDFLAQKLQCHRRALDVPARAPFAPRTAPGKWSIKSRVGGDLNGLSDWLDRLKWPAAKGEEQHDWEPPRVISGLESKVREARLKALGNAVNPAQVFPVLWGLRVRAVLGRSTGRSVAKIRGNTGLQCASGSEGFRGRFPYDSNGQRDRQRNGYDQPLRIDLQPCSSGSHYTRDFRDRCRCKRTGLSGSE